MTIDELIGKTLTQVSGEVGGEAIRFTTDDGAVYEMSHCQDCCESVQIEDICGDLQDLMGTPIVSAEASTSGENPTGVKLPDYQDSFTWTFYRISTAKGLVVIRWYGESNGYYSEDVQFEKVQ
jgi:hypothetical protein